MSDCKAKFIQSPTRILISSTRRVRERRYHIDNIAVVNRFERNNMRVDSYFRINKLDKE